MKQFLLSIPVTIAVLIGLAVPAGACTIKAFPHAACDNGHSTYTTNIINDHTQIATVTETSPEQKTFTVPAKVGTTDGRVAITLEPETTLTFSATWPDGHTQTAQSITTPKADKNCVPAATTVVPTTAPPVTPAPPVLAATIFAPATELAVTGIPTAPLFALGISLIVLGGSLRRRAARLA